MSFFERVYKIVKKIPKGRVATYGQIATILTEEPKNQKTEERVNTRTKELESSKTKKQTTARIVGWALHANKNPDIPCHRVVNKEGKIAVNFAFAGGWRE